MSELIQQLRSWSQQGLIRAVDYQLAKLVAEQSDSEQLQLLAGLVSSELAAGNVCLPLAHLQNPNDYWPEAMADLIKRFDWLQLSRVTENGAVLSYGATNLMAATPLVYELERFYLHRYWQFEVSVAEDLAKRALPIQVDTALLQQGLARYFQSSEELIDWQKVAAATAVQKRFSAISGGPGTGKTTTVIKLLALSIEQAQQQGKHLNIKLVAPTGKAAARLAESISKAKQQLALSSNITDLIPVEAGTLHRLLGVIPGSVQFRHHRDNPLHLDLLVLDEASMVDLPMMARLLDAMPADARLILLGDRDQLASVEAGSVLGDICSWPEQLTYSAEQNQQLQQVCALSATLPEGNNPGFADCLAQLRKSYRFHDQSGIGHVARAVNQGNPRQVAKVLTTGYPDLSQQPLTAEAYEAMLNQVVTFHVGLIRALRGGESAAELLARLTQLQLLAALREGPYGVAGLNERIRKGLTERGMIQTDSQWYAGRPVMITRNDPGLSLFNGDIGIAVPDETGRLKVWFESQGQVRGILPSRLPEHDTVYAMTVHKSQGSEFDQVLFILPPTPSPLLSRELLYTGITRAKKELALYATDHVLRHATSSRTERYAGLATRLWG